MSRKMFAVALAISLALSSTVGAQSNDVTISIPLNLTRLLPDLSKVAVECTMRGGAAPHPFGRDGITGRTELNVTGGQVVTTATVLMPIGNASPAVGMSVPFSCTLSGFSAAQQTWGPFIASAMNRPNENPALKLWLNPATPNGNVPFTVGGEFFW